MVLWGLGEVAFPLSTRATATVLVVAGGLLLRRGSVVYNINQVSLHQATGSPLPAIARHSARCRQPQDVREHKHGALDNHGVDDHAKGPISGGLPRRDLRSGLQALELSGTKPSPRAVGGGSDDPVMSHYGRVLSGALLTSYTSRRRKR